MTGFELKEKMKIIYYKFVFQYSHIDQRSVLRGH